MNVLLQVSFALYSLVAVLGLVFAAMYLTRSKFMPYHSAFVLALLA